MVYSMKLFHHLDGRVKDMEDQLEESNIDSHSFDIAKMDRAIANLQGQVYGDKEKGTIGILGVQTEIQAR